MRRVSHAGVCEGGSQQVAAEGSPGSAGRMLLDSPENWEEQGSGFPVPTAPLGDQMTHDDTISLGQRPS